MIAPASRYCINARLDRLLLSFAHLHSYTTAYHVSPLLSPPIHRDDDVRTHTHTPSKPTQACQQTTTQGRQRGTLPCTPFLALPPVLTSVAQRHEERKTQTKEIASQRHWRRLERPGLQEQLRNDGTLAFTGRNVDNVRELASHIRGDSDTDDDDDDDEADDAVEMTGDVPPAGSTSGAALLAMARPAKTRRPPLQTTDGEAFEIVEIDGRLVALDEDGWEILPNESAEASLLYSDVVRGSER